ncbi:hypothetical protein DAI21_18005 [Lelliottia sp. WB101]|uniref:ead/Ea22-like family protein n=1 Tax=Lelliottia sp. WB101 TaxID=2153385 RepID=UPI000D2253A5|nr:ead/Ea22-like family protein [Lelliottia sp. WB101]AVY99410.1 hypothetical protein DAI21_18005 [Lelliottia sp. WB101]
MMSKQKSFQKLYEAAAKATPGEWVAENGAIFSASEGTANYMLAEICGGSELTAEQDWLNAEFIAAANPPVVLALLGALEAAEKQITELTLANALNETTIAMQKEIK